MGSSKLLIYLTSILAFAISANAHVEDTFVLHKMLHSIAPEYGHYWYNVGFYGVLFYFAISLIFIYLIYVALVKLKIKLFKNKSNTEIIKKYKGNPKDFRGSQKLKISGTPEMQSISDRFETKFQTINNKNQ